MRPHSFVATALILFGVLSLSCGGGDGDSKGGGLVGFSTGTPQAGPVPSDGTSPAAPVVGGVVVTNAPVRNGDPLHVSVSFTDPQGDIATVNVGIAGQATHSAISVASVGAQTSGNLFLDLKPASNDPGTYTLVVSITDVAGHASAAVTVPFTILNPDGTFPSAGVDSGTSPLPIDAAPRPDTALPQVDGRAPDVPNALPDGSVTPSSGWHLVNSEFLVSGSDLDVLGGPVKSTQTGTGALLLDYYQDEGALGDMKLVHYRTDEGGSVLVKCQWEVLWEAPASYLAAEQTTSITVEHKPLEEIVWKAPVLKASFDAADMIIGSTTASGIVFFHPHGEKQTYRDTREEVYNARETMTTKTPIPKGNPGDRRAIYISFGEGYGMRYTYEWK